MARIKPLADLVEATIGPAFAAQGFASADILAAWPDLVGERLSGICQPDKLEWPRKRRGSDGQPEPATLVLRVEGAFALELQHVAPVLMERLNAHYGWRCIGRIVLKQGRLRPRTRRAPPPVELPEAERARIADALTGVEAEPLRAALDRLGTAIATTRRD